MAYQVVDLNRLQVEMESFEVPEGGLVVFRFLEKEPPGAVLERVFAAACETFPRGTRCLVLTEQQEFLVYDPPRAASTGPGLYYRIQDRKWYAYVTAPGVDEIGPFDDAIDALAAVPLG